MRISDWSSDVCSSDLFQERPIDQEDLVHEIEIFDPLTAEAVDLLEHRPEVAPAVAVAEIVLGAARAVIGASARRLHLRARADRKSVVSGKSVSVRVGLGGRRCINKKKTNNNQP